MYGQWQDALVAEEEHKQRRERRREARRKRKEEQLLNVIENEVMRRKTERNSSGSERDEEPIETSKAAALEEPAKPKKKTVIPSRIKLFNRFAMRRSLSSDRLHSSDREPDAIGSASLHDEVRKRRGSEDGRMVLSPSMPTLKTAESENGEEDGGAVAIDIHDGEEEESNSIGSLQDMDGLIV